MSKIAEIVETCAGAKIMSAPPTRSIICATDFPTNAGQACAAAAALAQRLGKPLVLLHVADQFDAHAETKEELEHFLHPIRERLDLEIQQLAAPGANSTHEDWNDEILACSTAMLALVYILCTDGGPPFLHSRPWMRIS